MAKEKRNLVMGMPLVGLETANMGYFVHAGKWKSADGDGTADCVVIAWERHKWPPGKTASFKMVGAGGD